MTDKQFFIETLKDELPRFERVFKAVPTDKLEWRPHERSKSGWELIKDTFSGEFLTFPIFLTTGKIDFAQLKPPEYATVADVNETMKKSFQETETIVNKMSEQEWGEKAVMTSGEKVEWETTKGKMAWALLLDAIHHRGQLSVYLRPMGGKVPSIYGPSADSGEM